MGFLTLKLKSILIRHQLEGHSMGYCWSKVSPTIDASYLREHDGNAKKAAKCLEWDATKGGCWPTRMQECSRQFVDHRINVVFSLCFPGSGIVLSEGALVLSWCVGVLVC